MEKFELTFKEGMTFSVVETLLEKIGGNLINENQYRYKKGRSKIEFDFFNFWNGFEVILIDYYNPVDANIDRIPDGEPDLIHINMIIKGEVVQLFNNKEKVLKSDSAKSVIIHNGLFPIDAYVPADKHYQSVGVRITKQVFKGIMPEIYHEIEKMFPNDDGIGYHTPLPVELITLLEQMFLYKTNLKLKTPYLLSRGIEVLAILIEYVISLIHKDELKGLHSSDYQRLLQIRQKLVTNFDQKISLNEIAEEFGVSTSKLKRDFKTLFDTNITQYRIQAKMEEAYKRLKSGKYSVLEVSIDLGYETPSKFSTMFKKIKGVSPKDIIP
ncbi:helix-turn-helix domain-containing protein [Flammeovirga aprica]|uniref:Helix-turn-helix transcriptional regulator n=1 Tax=Flammeovirga aprica JL-4 TaxID=694437 RepID=A0A7X9S0D0_9BACT|nr:AraC family transcriptional regulator [Flammeovirga aprica]NME72004.1 helix-turn-helix transcriptional regulator [Flammeovirga aprica JL-4]